MDPDYIWAFYFGLKFFLFLKPIKFALPQAERLSLLYKIISGVAPTQGT